MCLANLLNSQIMVCTTQYDLHMENRERGAGDRHRGEKHGLLGSKPLFDMRLGRQPDTFGRLGKRFPYTLLRYSRMRSAAVAPSPAAEATCLVLPCLTSPAAKTPGTLVSRNIGARRSKPRMRSPL